MKYILFFVSLAVILFSAWVSAPQFWYPLGGMSQADISNMYYSAITPAGFTFAIWSVIYLSWIIVSILILWLPFRSFIKKTFPFLLIEDVSKKIIFLFSIAIVTSALWLIPWSYNSIGLSLCIMLFLLATLKYLFHKTRKSQPLLRWSVDLFLGWIHIATVANVTVFLLYVGFSGWNIPEVYWAIAILGLAFLLTMYYQYRYHTYIISLVFIWTMLGEWVAHPAPFQRYAVMIYSIIIFLSMFIFRKQ